MHPAVVAKSPSPASAFSCRSIARVCALPARSLANAHHGRAADSRPSVGPLAFDELYRAEALELSAAGERELCVVGDTSGPRPAHQ
jgi:hypothetical protein